MLAIRSIDAAYGDIKVLKKVSLTIEQGEIVSLVGLNGAGKTTLINTASGILHCSSGEIEFLGKRIDKSLPHEIVEYGLIQVPEGRQLFPQMSVMDNLLLGAYCKRARKNADRIIKEIFGLFPILSERSHQMAGSLSGGEQQMLAIGRALASAPELLMLDEPSLGLAPLMVKEIFRIVKEINKRGITILIVEQNAVQCLALAHRAYIIENGEIILQGTGKELLEDEKLKKICMGV